MNPTLEYYRIVQGKLHNNPSLWLKVIDEWHAKGEAPQNCSVTILSLNE